MAAAAALVYLCLLELGCRRRTGNLGAFVFAFATMAWPYSRTFFREPLTVLAYLLAITVVPIVGLWRLSSVVNLPRPLALLYLVLPLITVAIYVARTVINVLLPDPF